MMDTDIIKSLPLHSPTPLRYIERFPANRDEFLKIRKQLSSETVVSQSAVALSVEGVRSLVISLADSCMALCNDETLTDEQKFSELGYDLHQLDDELYVVVDIERFDAHAIARIPLDQWKEALEVMEAAGSA